MMPQSKAKIFPANERGVSQSDTFRSCYSFNFQKYQQLHKIPFGNLQALNDDVLAPQQALQFVANADMFLVLIPLIGAVVYRDDKGSENYLAAGHVQAFCIAKNTAFALRNPYHDETVNFLQLWIQNESFYASEISFPAEVLLEENINKMNSVICHEQFSISIGKFLGREESSYQIKNNRNGIFAFVIDGQMEVQYRLLMPRDGLSLWEQEAIEWEALTANAILLIAEIKV